MTSSWFINTTPDVCLGFQADLSALADGELEKEVGGKVLAARAIAHLEVCAGCHDFFDDVRNMASAHRSFASPDELLDRLSQVSSADFLGRAEASKLTANLATIFYKLGKAYVLLATDEQYRNQIFEPAVQVEVEKTRGRGFVDGVVASGRTAQSDVDWTSARHLLNGRLSRIESHLERGKRLLDEALQIDPGCEEARLYRAFVLNHEGHRVRAAEEYREVFNTGIEPSNRGHAAVQLGKLLAAEQDYRRAVACFRWVVMSSLADVEPRFYFVRYNAAICYLQMGRVERSIASLRELLTYHPDQAAFVAETMGNSSPQLQELMATTPGFAEGLMEACPELFADNSSAASDSSSDEAHS
jgi:tetratricopeptide (TPR) repeat protein